MRQSTVLILGVILISCSNPGERDKSSFAYSYEVAKYYGDTLDAKNLRQVDYYDSTDKIIRTVGTEIGCTRFLYDNLGKLKEKVWSRNCLGGRREIMIYDSSANVIGTYVTTDTLINIDTVHFQQSLFYSKDGKLTKELKSERTDMDGNKIQTWSSYTYDQERIMSELITENGNPLWACRYEYNDSSQVTAIYRTRGRIFNNDFFRYNDEGLLIEKEVKGNEYPITPKVTFTVSVNRTIYKYDPSGGLIEEVLLGHRGNVQLKQIWIRNRR